MQHQDTKSDNHEAEGSKEGGSGRVQLACLSCRARRVRCSGEKPICAVCTKTNTDCEWPTGRKRKRTRKEMEEAERRASEASKEKGEMYFPRHTSATDSGSSLFTLGAGTGGDFGSGGIGSQTPSSAMFDFFNPDRMPRTTTASASAADLWPTDMQQPKSYAWPTGFTPEGEVASGPSVASYTMEPAMMMGPPDSGSGFSPDTDAARLMTALESQTAYIHGDPTEGKELELFYYRFSGSTAIHPGINRISLKLQRRTGTSSIAGAPIPESEASPAPGPPPIPEALFDSSGMPYPHIYQPLVECFFANLSQHFPSVSRRRLEERISTGTMSAFMMLSVCALSARFLDSAKDCPPQACVTFMAKAQELGTPLLHLPAHDVVTGLLLLAWANFGQNSESGLWQYSGMAFRMAIDLGLHEHSEIYESKAHQTRTRILFWSLFITDRYLAFSTGRPASIPEDMIEIPLPTDEDFFPDPARNMLDSAIEEVEPIPFVHLVRLMIICGRISNVLNGRRGRARTLVATNEPLPELLAELQTRLVQFYSNLPDVMRWSVDNFKHQQARGHGGTFLSLHLWANAVLALVYHPELLRSPSGTETPLNRSMNRSVKLSLASSRQICECMVFADLVASSSYCASPFVVQPLYVAAMALIHEMKAASLGMSTAGPPMSTISQQNQGTATDMFLNSMARQNLNALLKAVMRMEVYWAGVTYVASLLEQRSGGFAQTRPLRGQKKTFISLPDKGLLRRFVTDEELPFEVAPPTHTSLRDSIVKNESARGPSPYWLADLLTGYSVEGMFVQPANSIDLARLLANATPDGESTRLE